MGRMLGPSDYGILVVLMSFVYIFGIPSETIQSLVTKYVSKFNLKKENGKIKFILKEGIKKAFIFGGILYSFLAIVSFMLSTFLDINYWLLLITNTLIFLSLISPIIRGIFQGKKEFLRLGNNLILESLLRLFFSISGVLFGFKIFGAIGGFILGVLSSVIIGISLEKEVLKSRQKMTELKDFKKEGLNYFFTMFVILVALSLDTILARRFFSPEIAGEYAVLSMLGKMIFFGTSGISKAMFPITVEKYAQNKGHEELFFKSLSIISIICLGGIFFYYLFPELIIKIFYGSEYLEMSEYLVYSGIALSFLALSNLTMIYGLSSEKIKNSYILILFLLLEFLLLWKYNGSIKEYILAFMLSNIVMFIGSLFYLKIWKK